jgi:hypothetical protein
VKWFTLSVRDRNSYTVDKKQLENVQYFNHCGTPITNYARYTREIKPRIAMAKAKFNKKISFHQQIVVKVKEEIRKCCIWSAAVYGAES